MYSALFFYGVFLLELERKRSGIEEKFFELTTQIVKDQGYELYDMEYVAGSSTLQVYIMDPETKSAVIEDCVKVDRAFNEPVEELDWIPSDFVLEVSSPGVFRKLKTLRHLEMAKGEMIKVSITGKLDEEQSSGLPKSLKKQNQFRGNLVEANENKIILETNDVNIEIDIAQIKKASLDPDF